MVMSFGAMSDHCLYLRALLILAFCLSLVPALGQSLLTCGTASSEASGYRCNANGSRDECKTFAILRANSYFSSLYNLSYYLGLNRMSIAAANGFSADIEFLPKDLPLLIPIECKCNSGFFQADVNKTTIRGESFYGIAVSLEGLTTCKAIRDKNPGILPVSLSDKLQLLVPLRCQCPSSTDPKVLLLSYPIREGDTISNLATRFNTTPEGIISSNNRSSASFEPESLVPLTTILIPVQGDPAFGEPALPSLHFPSSSDPVVDKKRKRNGKSRMWTPGIYIAVFGALVGISIAIAAAFLVIQRQKKQQQYPNKEADLELQQLGLSIRTTSDKKVSFDESQCTLDGHIIDATPRNMLVEAYIVADLKRATESFGPSNHIEGQVFHGRLNGKDLAVKQMKQEAISKIDFRIFQDATHHHPNIIRLLGTSLGEGSDQCLVFEYAKNGSLKDWLHGGLGIKNQFIASCYRILTWEQRLKICLDVAVALQYMHQIMNPSYIHRNVKSRNIFLDEEFNAKIGNFGLGKCTEDESEDTEFCSADPSTWNHGYFAPEYVLQGQVSPSIDIFAYGVVLLEVLSGQRPAVRPTKKGEKCISLSKQIKSIALSENGKELREWMDSALGDNYSFDAAVKLANLARACVDDDPSFRPNAGEIVDKLSKMVEEPAGSEPVAACESSSKPLVNKAAASDDV